MAAELEKRLGIAQIRHVSYCRAALVGEGVPDKMRERPQEQGSNDQSETAKRSPAKRDGKANPPLPVAARSQADGRQLHDVLENPENEKSDRQTKEKNPLFGVTEVAAWIRKKEVAEVRRHAADHQRGEDQLLSQRQDSGGMRKRKRQLPMVARSGQGREAWAGRGGLI